MAVSPTRHNDAFSTAPQISPQDLAQIAAMGFKTVINNRPDLEGGAEQPTSAQVQAAAVQAGLVYAHLPVISGQITEVQARQFAELLAKCPKPVLAFCRSGARSQNLYRLASGQASVPAAASTSAAAACNWGDSHDILIIGGGSAGIGLAASLLRRQPNLQISIVEPNDKHYYQPAWTLVGAGEFDPKASVREPVPSWVMAMKPLWVFTLVGLFRV